MKKTHLLSLLVFSSLLAAPVVTLAQSTTNSPAGGELPDAVTPIGGIVTDLIGLNDTRVITQLPASTLFSGFVFENPLTIGTQMGFSNVITDQLGGGIKRAAVRITLQDGDTAPGDFAFDTSFLLLNGVNFGNFSLVATLETDGVGALISENPAGGFRNDTLDTGFFFLSDAGLLATFFNTLTSTEQILFQSDILNGEESFLDFTAGLDGDLIDVITEPIIDLDPDPDLEPTIFQNQVNLNFVDGASISSLIGSGLPTATVTRQAHLSTSRSALRDVNGRIFRHRAGLNAASATALAAPQSTGDGKSTGGLGKDGKYSLPLEPAMPEFRRFEIFATGDYGRSDVDSINRELDFQAGYEGDTWAGTVGAEFYASKNFTIGAAFTYASSDFDFSDSLGDIEIEGPSGSVYLSYANPSFYFDVLYNYGSYDVETGRNAIFENRKYNGETDSDQKNAELNLGYNITHGNLVTGPIAALRFTQGDIEGYNEKNLGNAAIRFDAQTYETLVSTLGWQASYKITSGNLTIVPQVRASWEHEYLDDTEVVGAELINSPFFQSTINQSGTVITRLPGNFRATQETEALGTDWLAAGAGVTVLIGDRVSVTLDYEGEFFRADSASHYGSVRASYSF